jgi:hypothetical protein
MLRMQYSVLSCGCLTHFSHNAIQLPLKICPVFLQISCHFITSITQTNFYLYFGVSFTFGEADFHKIKARITVDYAMI